jgi:hypothetical protein
MGGVMKPAREILKALLITVAIGGGLLAAAPHAEAATVDVVVDSTTITLSGGDNGTHVGKVTLSNLSDKMVPLTAAIPGHGGCDVKPDPRALDPGRRTEVTLTFSASCDVAKGADVTLSFGPHVRPSSSIVKVQVQASTAPDWSILLWAFASALGLTLLLLAAVLLWRRGAKKVADPKWPGWSKPIAGLGTDWSFKDSWAGNITIGSTVIIALLAASNILEAILGTKPEAALGLLAVAGGIASLLVGLGPLVVKSIGKDTQTPTVGGAVLAAGITLVGVLGQGGAAAIQAWKLTSQDLPRVLIAALTALVATFVFKYAVASINDWIKKAAADPPRKEASPEVQAARIVAKAIAAGPHAPVAPNGEGVDAAAADNVAERVAAERELPPFMLEPGRNALL